MDGEMPPLECTQCGRTCPQTWDASCGYCCVSHSRCVEVPSASSRSFVNPGQLFKRLPPSIPGASEEKAIALGLAISQSIPELVDVALLEAQEQKLTIAPRGNYVTEFVDGRLKFTRQGPEFAPLEVCFEWKSSAEFAQERGCLLSHSTFTVCSDNSVPVACNTFASQACARGVLGALSIVIRNHVGL